MNQDDQKVIHWDDLPDELTPQNIADIFHISRRSVYNLFDLKPEHGGIPNYSIGISSRRADKQDVIAWRNSKKNFNPKMRGANK